MKSISVVVPVYNVEKYLDECLNSLVVQTCLDFEVIIVNDGSTDLSLDIANSFENKFDAIKVISIENSGLSIARNVGIENASAKYILFLDSDDMLDQNTIELCLSQIKQFKLDCLLYEATSFKDSEYIGNFLPTYIRPKDKGVMVGKEMFNYLIESKKYTLSACCYITRKSIVESIKFEPNILHEDNLFTTKLLLDDNMLRVKILNKALFLRRLRPDSIMTKAKSKKNAHGYFVCANKLLSCMKNDKKTDENLASFIQCLLTNFSQALIEACGSFSREDKKQAMSILHEIPIRFWKLKTVISILMPSLFQFLRKIKKIKL